MNCNRATIIIEDRCTINTESVIKFRTLLVFKNCLWYTCIRMKVRPVLSPTPDFWVKHHSRDSRVMDSNFSLVRHYFSHSITLGDVTNTWNWQVNSCQGLDPIGVDFLGWSYINRGWKIWQCDWFDCNNQTVQLVN